MKILVTGGTGQVGHALIQTLQGQGEIFAPDRSQLDLSNSKQIAQVIRNYQPDIIINPAAYTAVDKAESEPDAAMQINGIAPGIMAREAKELGIPLIHYSTDYVYDGCKQDADGNWAPYVETDATAPLSVYGKTKLAGEQAIIESGCSHLIFRTSWVYSMFGKNFLLTMLRLAAEKDALNVVNDQWGAPTWAGSIANVTKEILDRCPTRDWWENNSGVYHMSNAGYTNWHGFATEIIRLADTMHLLTKPAPKVMPISHKEYPTPARRPSNSRLDCSLLSQKLEVILPQWDSALHSCLAKR